MDKAKTTMDDLIQALKASLFLVIVNVFIMPYNVWIGAVQRLSELQKTGIVAELRKTELAVLNWLKLVFDSAIFFTYVLAPIVIIVEMAQVTRSGGRIFTMILGTLITIYFLPLLLSLVKELITLALVQVRKLEQIEENTQK